ncbi:MAG: hypothetical protein WCK73_11420 [Deltaproteobacteria bacterium]
MTPGSTVRPVGLRHYAVAAGLAALATALKVVLAAYVIPTFILPLGNLFDDRGPRGRS